MLTVLLTTYNDSNFLSYSIRSILSQSFTDFELLIIDDGSIDNTHKIVKSFNDNRITYHYIKHVGRSSALNCGLRLSKNDWLVLADADDIMYPDKLKIYSKNISDKVNRIVWSDCYYFNKSTVLFYINYPVSESEIKKHFLLHSMNNFALINRKHIFQYTNGYVEEIKIAEDYDLWLKLILKSELIVVPEFLTLINHRTKSYSKNNVEKTNLQIYEIQKRIYDNNIIFGEHNVKNENEILELRGWREFFYGDKTNARKYFFRLKLGIIKKPKIMIAILLTFFSKPIVNAFIGNAFRYRIVYYLKYFSLSSKKARELLQQYS